MKDSLPRYTLRVSQSLLDKLEYIACFEGQTKNKELEQLIKKESPNLKTKMERLILKNMTTKSPAVEKQPVIF